jgi:hypothetical protein
MYILMCVVEGREKLLFLTPFSARGRERAREKGQFREGG